MTSPRGGFTPRVKPFTREAIEDLSRTWAVYYIEHYGMARKIREAKLAGTFEATVGKPPEPSPFWWARLKWRHSG